MATFYNTNCGKFMTVLTRSELKNLVGGVKVLPECNTYSCDCGFTWHPEWGQWEGCYSSTQDGGDMYYAVFAMCGGPWGDPPAGGTCTLISTP